MNTKPPVSSASSTGSRSSIVQLAIKGKEDLQTAYIPLFKEGGIFIAATRDYKLGDDVYVLLTLPDDIERHPVAGKVAWITPAQAAGHRSQGVGVRFPSGEKSLALKTKIEGILGADLSSNRPTQTI